MCKGTWAVSRERACVMGEVKTARVRGVGPLTPSSAISKSTVALSVSISATRSPTSNVSPSLATYLAMFPFVMVGLSAGMPTTVCGGSASPRARRGADRLNLAHRNNIATTPTTERGSASRFLVGGVLDREHARVPAAGRRTFGPRPRALPPIWGVLGWWVSRGGCAEGRQARALNNPRPAGGRGQGPRESAARRQLTD
jgi:hypothetical protein